MELGAANQVVSKERRDSPEVSMADFKGVVQGIHQGITETGSGIVEYNGKTYKTRRVGTKSIPKGTRVSLEYRQYYYISY